MPSSSARVPALAEGARTTTPEQLVDTTRHALDRPHSAEWLALVARCRAELDADSACVLPGFLLPEAAARARDEVLPLLGDAYYCEKSHTPYLAPTDPAFPADHPRNREVVSDLGALPDDRIPSGGVLRTLYDWPRLRSFIAAVLGVEALYPYADPLGSLNLNVFQPGQQLGWHFDNADWAVTLMLQPAEAGGVYEYVPGTRTADDERYDGVAAVLDGADTGVRRLAVATGALVLFRGRYTLHRVTPVTGARPRLVAVLSYDTTPGVMLTEHNRRLFYGRTG